MTKPAVQQKGTALQAVRHVDLDLSPSPEAAQGLTLKQEAQALIVKDVDSHRAAKVFIRDGKGIVRNISEHWSRITRRVDDLKRGLLDDKRSDLAPVEEAVAIVERKALDYENADAARVREENDRRQRAAEEQARTEREQQLREQEEQALALERDSKDLSNRERVFVEAIVTAAKTADAVTSRIAAAAATRAGFKNPEQAAQRLLATDKILTELKNKRSAIAIREQAMAKAAAPLDVKPVEEVKRQTASVAGTATKTYYSCVVDDAEALVNAVMAGVAQKSALEPCERFLGEQARQIKDPVLFAQAFPGCRLISRQGISG